MNKFPSDFRPPSSPGFPTGFGGDASKNQAQNRADLKRTPVILVHGNASNSVDATFGMQKMADFLKAIGYQDCEIWAMDYLGEGNTRLILQGVHRDHIDKFRAFVDRVRDYLGVDKLDFIAHSLGCGMVNCYLRGYQPNGKFNNEDDRFGVASTVVNLAGAIYGLKGGVDEFKTGSEFEIESHKFKGVVDDTPFGSNNKEKQISPVPEWKLVVSQDNGQIRYVALIAKGDFVDAQNTDTGHRNGADLNKRYDLGPSTQGHEAIIKSQTVFDDFKPYLNQSPPQPRVKISVDKDSGNYGPGLQIGVTVEPANVPVVCTAKRLTREFQAGAIVEMVDETDTRTLASGQSLTLAHDGAWEVVFSASGTEDVTRTYGVNVRIPEVTILTSNETPFKSSLVVEATATKGKTYFSTDNKLMWTEGANVTIHETSTVYFMAIDPEGLPSALVSRDFERQVVMSVTATLTEHFIAKRIDVTQFVALLQKFGATAKVTLYFVNDKWVLDPDTPEVSAKAPVVHVSVDSGVLAQPVTVMLEARHDTDAAPKIHYTLDGSLPTEHSPYFNSSGLLKLDKAGTRTIKFRARDAFGHWSGVETKTYTMNIKDAQPKISADRHSGEYSEGVDVTIAASDDTDRNVTVYYTDDGSDASDPHNRNRHSFADRKTFSIKTNGNHAISCYAKDSAGNETLQSFAWQINDQQYPETSLSPSMGGMYVDSVAVALSPSERCEWTKYTTDGSEPSETNGDTYSGPIAIGKTTALKFRSKDNQGNLEPVKTATFVVTPKTPQTVFDNRAGSDGYVKAKPDGSDAFVGSFDNLEIGASRDGKESRAILYFDTSTLPDNAVVNKAYLEVKLHSRRGDPWADGRRIAIDVQDGCFGSSQAVQVDDWGDAATAEAAGHIGKFTSGTTRSSEFSREGVTAINTTGPTQIRLKLEPSQSSPNNSLFIKGGADAKLFVEYFEAGT